MQNYTTDNHPQTSPNAAGVAGEPETPRGWLAQWPTARRSLISNLFHTAVRNGVPTPALIVHAVKWAIEKRLRHTAPPRNTRDETLSAVWQALQTAPQEAYSYAQSVLDWESLPRAERERLKQERGRHFQQQYTAQLPVTLQQQAYLQSLGYTGEPPTNRAEASMLIDGLLSARRGQR